jgi:hypothetical protein
MRAPDFAEPLVAYRAWRLAADGSLLSVHWISSWPWQQRMSAGCRFMHSRRHESPAADCTCGIYALREPLTAVSYARTHLAAVVGSVHLWGDVVPADRGFRAQYAYPKTLCLFADHWTGRRRSEIQNGARAIEARYRVPCHVVHDWYDAPAALTRPTRTAAGEEEAGEESAVPPFLLHPGGWHPPSTFRELLALLRHGGGRASDR